MTKKKILLGIVLLISFNLYSQVGGLSASKLSTMCTNTVGNKTIEFEPSFGVSLTNSVWTSDGGLQNSFSTNDSINSEASTGFRFSYGAFKNMEIGVKVPTNVNMINLGMKYKLPFGDIFTTGLLAGLNTPIGNKTFKGFENSMSYAGGFVTSLSLTDKFAIDSDFQFQKYISSSNVNHYSDIFIGTDFGYFVTNKLQFVLGANYSSSYFKESILNNYLLTLNMGFTIEHAENFILVVNTPYDVLGKMSPKSFGVGLALTIMID